MRRKRALEYVVPRPRAGTAQALATSFAEMGAQMQWGSPSVATWRRACAASLRASRRRRGLDA